MIIKVKILVFCETFLYEYVDVYVMKVGHAMSQANMRSCLT